MCGGKRWILCAGRDVGCVGGGDWGVDAVGAGDVRSDATLILEGKEIDVKYTWCYCYWLLHTLSHAHTHARCIVDVIVCSLASGGSGRDDM